MIIEVYVCDPCGLEIRVSKDTVIEDPRQELTSHLKTNKDHRFVIRIGWEEER